MAEHGSVTWRYRCSLCGKLVEVDELSKHVAEEKAKLTWPGRMTWTRVDDEDDE